MSVDTVLQSTKYSGEAYSIQSYIESSISVRGLKVVVVVVVDVVVVVVVVEDIQRVAESIHASVCLISQITPHILCSTSAPIHYLTIILLFSPSYSELGLLNEPSM